MTDKAQVTQADRDAAADFWSFLWSNRRDGESSIMREGFGDKGPVVQAFAHHRLAAEQAAIELCAKVAEELSCNSCGHFFHPSMGHYDEDCPKARASWYSARDSEDIAAAIRALATLVAVPTLPFIAEGR